MHEQVRSQLIRITTLKSLSVFAHSKRKNLPWFYQLLLTAVFGTFLLSPSSGYGTDSEQCNGTKKRIIIIPGGYYGMSEGPNGDNSDVAAAILNQNGCIKATVVPPPDTDPWFGRSCVEQIGSYYASYITNLLQAEKDEICELIVLGTSAGGVFASYAAGLDMNGDICPRKYEASDPPMNGWGFTAPEPGGTGGGSGQGFASGAVTAMNWFAGITSLGIAQLTQGGFPFYFPTCELIEIAEADISFPPVTPYAPLNIYFIGSTPGNTPSGAKVFEDVELTHPEFEGPPAHGTLIIGLAYWYRDALTCCPVDPDPGSGAAPGGPPILSDPAGPSQIDGHGGSMSGGSGTGSGAGTGVGRVVRMNGATTGSGTGIFFEQCGPCPNSHGAPTTSPTGLIPGADRVCCCSDEGESYTEPATIGCPQPTDD